MQSILPPLHALCALASTLVTPLVAHAVTGLVNGPLPGHEQDGWKLYKNKNLVNFKTTNFSDY